MSLPPPQLDHLVFGGPDLAQAVGLVAELTGVAAVAGGRHPEHGTANYLIGIGHGAYLEIIGPDPRAAEPAHPRWLGLDALAAPRLLTWALRSPDLAASVAAARARGYDPGQSRSMSRLADDGTRLVWQLTPDTVASRNGVVPFLIDWGATAHPSTRDLPTLELRTLILTHHRTEQVGAELAALGTPRRVSAGPAGLSAELVGPDGWTELR
ncbi:MAG: VOC family protein [Actinomycetota bacterium]|nr:VOC family protein [Actinomycetota bacterium]